MPSRRTVLQATTAGLALSLAGCSGTSSEDPEENSTTQPLDEQNGDEDPVDYLTASEVESAGPDAAGADYPAVTIDPDEAGRDGGSRSATVVEQFDEESPARIRITFTNVSDETRTFWFGAVAPFHPDPADHPAEPARLHLEPRGPDSPPSVDGPTDGCWLFGEEPILLLSADSEELAPGEHITRDYDLYSLEADACLAEGTYRFEDGWENGWGIDVHLG